jgi:hypothetical protein
MLKTIGNILEIIVYILLSIVLAGLMCLMILFMYYQIFQNTNISIMPFWIQVIIFAFLVIMWVIWGFVIFKEQFKKK